MPGSPPNKMTEPGTIPPPTTWSNSCMPVAMRESFSVLMSDKIVGLCPEEVIGVLADETDD